MIQTDMRFGDEQGMTAEPRQHERRQAEQDGIAASNTSVPCRGAERYERVPQEAGEARESKSPAIWASLLWAFCRG